jgi:hypothetical protein
MCNDALVNIDEVDVSSNKVIADLASDEKRL